MKKISICLIVIILLTVTLFRIDSVELLKKLTLTDLTMPVNQSDVQVEKDGKEKDIQVRIVLKNIDSQSIFYSNIVINSDGMNIFYGKNFATKKNMNHLKLNAESSYFDQGKILKIESKHPLTITKGMGVQCNYAGCIYIYKENSGFVLVNQVNLEDYVAAVVSSEIGERAPVEALRAQAICARTYICNVKPKQYKKYNALADDSTDYQVYNKVSAGKECIRAARDTRNLVMMYHSKPIKAYYFSTSCGYTTNYRIWGRDKLAYLTGCEVSGKQQGIQMREESQFRKYIKSGGMGYEKKCPYYRWTTYMTSAQIETAVYSAVGVHIGNFEKAEVNSRGIGGIASQITIYGDKRQVVINNQTQIRKVFSSMYMVLKLNDGSEKRGIVLLPSAFIAIDTIKSNKTVSGLKIYGGGFGHGSGMSQNGAIEMAKRGFQYHDILNKFYRDVEIKKYIV